MEISMTAVLDVTAVNPAEGSAGVASGTDVPVQTGEQSPFGRLLTDLAVATGQNAEVAVSGQTVDMQLLEKLSQAVQSSLAMGQAAGVDQKGSARMNAMESGIMATIPGENDAISTEQSVLAQQLAASAAAFLAPSSPAPAAGAAKQQEDSPAEAKEDSADQVLGMVNADVSFMLQMLRQPVLSAQEKAAKQESAPVAVTPAAAASVAAVQPELIPVEGVQGEKLSASPIIQGEQPKAVAQPLQQSAELPVPEQSEAAVMPAKASEQGRAGETKQSERAVFRQKMAEQGVAVEEISANEAVDRSAKIDLGFAEVVIRESAEPVAASKEPGAVTTAEHGKMTHGNPMMAHAQETSEPTRQVQASSPEPAKPVNHDQIFSQVREKLAAVDMGRDGGQVVLRLNPEELGELKINVRMDSQRLRIDIVTESPTVKEALLNNMNSLREVLAKQNIVMDRFDVSTGGHFQQAFRDGRTWEQQAGANPKPASRWAVPGEVDDSLVAANAQYGRNRDYSMVDVRF